MSKTDEVRHLLDEREIKYCGYYNGLTYFRLIPDVEDDFFTTVEETRTHRLILKVGFKSPKQAVNAIQAIAATLGCGTCHLISAPQYGEGCQECSACGEVLDAYLFDGGRCPNCGAKVVDDG